VVPAMRVESVPCFAALPSAARAALADAFEEVVVLAGEKLASQGDFAYQVFAIIEGSARVEQEEKALAMLGPGDLFGEVGLLLTGRRTATVVAETPMVVLALFDQPFRRLSKEYPAFADVVREQCQGRFAGPAATV
jgi:CRP/FNR family transcriptional regulator, cyclic AMP receptor protein